MNMETEACRCISLEAQSLEGGVDPSSWLSKLSSDLNSRPKMEILFDLIQYLAMTTFILICKIKDYMIVSNHTTSKHENSLED